MLLKCNTIKLCIRWNLCAQPSFVWSKLDQCQDCPTPLQGVMQETPDDSWLRGTLRNDSRKQPQEWYCHVVVMGKKAIPAVKDEILYWANLRPEKERQSRCNNIGAHSHRSSNNLIRGRRVDIYTCGIKDSRVTVGGCVTSRLSYIVRIVRAILSEGSKIIGTISRHSGTACARQWLHVNRPATPKQKNKHVWHCPLWKSIILMVRTEHGSEKICIHKDRTIKKAKSGVLTFANAYKMA